MKSRPEKNKEKERMKEVKGPKGRGGGRNKNTSEAKVSGHLERPYIVFCLNIPSSPPGGTMI